MLMIFLLSAGSVVQSYAQLSGKSHDLGRTQSFLEEIFHSGATTCLICIGSVKRLDPVSVLLFANANSVSVEQVLLCN